MALFFYDHTISKNRIHFERNSLFTHYGKKRFKKIHALLENRQMDVIIKKAGE